MENVTLSKIIKLGHIQVKSLGRVSETMKIARSKLAEGWVSGTTEVSQKGSGDYHFSWEITSSLI